jgi:hypothetical protein
LIYPDDTKETAADVLLCYVFREAYAERQVGNNSENPASGEKFFNEAAKQARYNERTCLSE